MAGGCERQKKEVGEEEEEGDEGRCLKEEDGREAGSCRASTKEAKASLTLLLFFSFSFLPTG